jgi:UDP-N-acetylmuramoyl-tripeptide--D-alanyl-D-alanine ligase
VAIITTVEAVHIENFADITGIADAKAEIFAGLDPDGVAILNRDNPHFDRIEGRARDKAIRTIWSFGVEPAADARLVDADSTAEGSIVDATILGRAIRFRLTLPGRHHIPNALAVLLAVAALDGDVEQAAADLADFAPVAGRGVSFDVPVPNGSIRVIDETYNASPAAVRAALSVLALMKPGPGGRRLAVLGDMLELGSAAASMHAALAAALAGAGVDLVFTAGPLSRHLHDALPAHLRGAHAPDAAALAPIVAGAVSAGDVVLVKGSAGSRMGTIVAALRMSVPEGELRRAL